MGLADDRKQVNLMTVHVSKSVTVHEVSNSYTILNQCAKLIVIVYPLTTYCSTGLVIAAEFDVSSNVTLTCKGTSNSA